MGILVPYECSRVAESLSSQIDEKIEKRGKLVYLAHLRKELCFE